MIQLFLLLLIGIFLAKFDKKPYWYVVRKWSRPFNIKVVYYGQYTDRFECDTETHTLFISRYNQVTHSKAVYIYSIAHEVGHLVGAAIDQEYPESQRISNRTSKKAILADETRAWEIAKHLLQDENLYERVSFEQLKDACLQQYQQMK